MNEDITIDSVPAYFLKMSSMQRQLFLTRYVHQITIFERGYFADKNYESARLCNETIHRIVGYMSSPLLNPEGIIESSFIETIIASAAQKGWSEVLLRLIRKPI
jgi:hypothetical protein